MARQGKQVNGRTGSSHAQPSGSLGDAALLDSEAVKRKAPEPADGAPAVGKTGRGARAERPSEGSDRKQASALPVEQGRRSKAPAETPKARGKPSAAARPAR